MANNPYADLPGQNLRARRSRKDRPCDRCRRMKQLCHIVVRGESCSLCQKVRKSCTFAGPPPKRWRGPTEADDTWRGLELHETSELSLAAQACEPQSCGPKEGCRAAPTGAAALSGLLDSLMNEESDIIHSSLDLEVDDREEFQYVGTGAFALLTMAGEELRDSSLAAADGLEYRQVADKSPPVYFLKGPSKIYETTGSGEGAADLALRSIVEVIQSRPGQLAPELVKTFTRSVWPSLPIFNKVRFEGACLSLPGAGCRPTALLVGILAYMAVTIPGPRDICMKTGKILLQLVDAEYRHPRLETLQLALLDVFGRPALNPGGNHIAILRAIGCAQVLGLHRDCSSWRLPIWEKSIRKRLWWSICIADKWNSFVFGRPSNISDLNSVRMPTLKDGDWSGAVNATEAQSSIAPFVGLCHLTVILENLLTLNNRSQSSVSASHLLDLKKSADMLAKIDELYAGIRDCPSFRIDKNMISIFICQLGLEGVAASMMQLLRAAECAIEVVKEGIDTIDSLGDEDYNGFWPPWAPFHISHALALLLRIVLMILAHPDRNSSETPTTNLDAATGLSPQFLIQKTCELAERLVNATVQAESAGWEVAAAAIPRVTGLVKSCPKLREIQALREALGLPAPSGEVIEASGRGGQDIFQFPATIDCATEFHTSMDDFLSLLS